MKKILAILLSVVLISQMLAIQPVHAQYQDIPKSHTYYDEVTYLLDQKIIEPATLFAPKETATRVETVVMIAKALGLNGTKRQTDFKDVPASNPASGYIQSAVEQGIVNGYSDDTFRPNTRLTRGHLAAFIGRAMTLPAATTTFKDMKVGDTGYEFVGRLAAANITTGYDDKTYRPFNPLTRVHLAVFVYRAIQYNQSTKTTKTKVHFIDVGQGDATLIQTATGKNMLIDGGVRNGGNDLVTYLRAQGVQKLDYVVATHPDADHIGGLIAVLNSISIGQFIDSGKTHTSSTYEQMIRLIAEKNIPYTVPTIGTKIALDKQVNIDVLYADPANADNNDASLVLKATHNKVSYLLMADASKSIETLLLKNNVAAQILKAGHHGSSTSSGLNFLQAVKPNAIILSYGEGNSYGHPHKEVLANIQKVGAASYGTAEHGSIVISTDGVIYTVETDKKVASSDSSQQKTEVFANCTELRKVYPNGVAKGHPAYSTKHDRDQDGMACES